MYSYLQHLLKVQIYFACYFFLGPYHVNDFKSVPGKDLVIPTEAHKNSLRKMYGNFSCQFYSSLQKGLTEQNYLICENDSIFLRLLLTFWSV